MEHYKVVNDADVAAIGQEGNQTAAGELQTPKWFVKNKLRNTRPLEIDLVTDAASLSGDLNVGGTISAPGVNAAAGNDVSGGAENGGAGGALRLVAGDGGAVDADGSGDGGAGGDVVLSPGSGGAVDGGGGSAGADGKLRIFDGTGAAKADRPTIATQVESVNVAAFNTLRDYLILLGLVVDGD